jgi:hypothetical protein
MAPLTVRAADAHTRHSKELDHPSPPAPQDPWYAAGSWVPELIAMANGQDVLGQVQEAVQFSEAQLLGEAVGQ